MKKTTCAVLSLAAALIAGQALAATTVTTTDKAAVHTSKDVKKGSETKTDESK